MKREAFLPLAIAAASLAVLFPVMCQAKGMENSTTMKNTATLTAGQLQARSMVPAQADLVKSVNASKLQRGDQFRATLKDTVYLKNGLELPRGTSLLGTVTVDHMHADGDSRLALRFTQAELKSGKMVPVDATIMGIFPPQEDAFDEYGDLNATPWNGKTLQLDQIDAVSGADLHSRIGGQNSAVIVAHRKDDVKVPAGSVFSLAITEQRTGGQNHNGMSGAAGA